MSIENQFLETVTQVADTQLEDLAARVKSIEDKLDTLFVSLFASSGTITTKETRELLDFFNGKA